MSEGKEEKGMSLLRRRRQNFAICCLPLERASVGQLSGVLSECYPGRHEVTLAGLLS